ncbi:MAG: hypothetical protein EOO12_00690 [Chitinophagaceae bacterium]|nr:MAG: hypothetical protein EOO12_00690 [Chitinophagaceae bacterium]
MKKIMLGAAVLLLASAASAQLRHGRWLVGGGITLMSGKIEDDAAGVHSERRGAGTQFNAMGGVFVRNNLLLGGRLGFRGSQFTSSDPAVPETPAAYDAGLLLRSYYGLGKGFSFFLNAGADYASYGYNDLVNSLATEKVIHQEAGFRLHAGVAYRFGRRFLLETNLPDLLGASYSYEERKAVAGGPVLASEKTLTGGIGPRDGVQLNLGFNILLGKQ